MSSKVVRVIVEIGSRVVAVSLTDTTGVRIEHERFAVAAGADDLATELVGRDVFDLLYQCAADGVHGESDGMAGGA